MIEYVIYALFIIFLIYFINRFIKFILNKTKNNSLLKQDLLKHRESYKKQIDKFKKLFNEVKNLTLQNNKLQIDYNHLRKHNYKTREYCNSLTNSLGNIGEDLSKIYKNKISSIYKDIEYPKLNIDRSWLDKNKSKSLEYYKTLARNKSTIPNLPKFNL
jgi:hypothetical protein